MPFQEVVEAEGHLIDSHIMENIFDQVVEHHGRFEVEQFRIGRTNSEPSYLRLKVETAEAETLRQLLNTLLKLGCAPVETGDAELRPVERDRCAPEDFYSTTNHRTHVRIGGRWIEVEKQRMDALIVVREGRAVCRRMRDLRLGDEIVVGLSGIRVIPELQGARPAGNSPSWPTASPRSVRWKRRCGRPPRWRATPWRTGRRW